MGVEPPFMYRPVKSESGPPSPFRKEFDPKAVSRASWQSQPPRPKQEGPLVNFNRHPDSYFILPYGQTTAKPMNPAVKKWIKWMRIVQLVLRCFEVLAAIALLAMLIMLRGMDASTGWIMRVVAGVALLHTVYGVYHLARKPTGRTPASSAAYSLFAVFFDVSIVPFLAFTALVADTKQDSWSIILSNQSLTPTFSKIVFYLATVGGGLHLVSLGVGLYLAVTFRKITMLPPDMNPLEDNLTSRHKRNKSSMSTATTLTASEKRLSDPLESKRSSGAAYEDLSRPPTIPFFHTRTQSTTSLSTYKSTPPPSRDARMDLPSRQYQVLSNNSTTDLKRQSYSSIPSSKRGSYTEIPLYETGSTPPSRRGTAEAWYTTDSITQKTRSKSSSPRKGAYTPVPNSDTIDLPDPLSSNPPTPRHKHLPSRNLVARESPLSEISNNKRNSSDIADQRRDTFSSQYYGDLKPATPPVMMGSGGRQVSSGNDFSSSRGKRRDVSGKIAEEGRSVNGNGWGTRFRKVSGL